MTQKTNQTFQDPFLAVVVSVGRREVAVLHADFIIASTSDRSQSHHLGRPRRDWRLPYLPRSEPGLVMG